MPNQVFILSGQKSLIKFEVLKILFLDATIYSLEVALRDSKYSLKVEKLFISPLILAKREYCEIIKHFDSKDSVFSSFHEKDKKEKDIIFSSKLEFPSLRSKRSFSEISIEFSDLDDAKFQSQFKTQPQEKKIKKLSSIACEGIKIPKLSIVWECNYCFDLPCRNRFSNYDLIPLERNGC